MEIRVEPIKFRFGLGRNEFGSCRFFAENGSGQIRVDLNPTRPICQVYPPTLKLGRKSTNNQNSIF